MTKKENEMKLKIIKIIISFEKYLRSPKAQSVLEYALLLVVIATLSLSIILPRVNNIFSNAVEDITKRVTGQ